MELEALTPWVYDILLVGAFVHATWNTLLGSRSDINPYSKITIFNLAPLTITVPLLGVFGFPIASAVPYLTASVFLNACYTFSLAFAYRDADPGQVVPVVRGFGVLQTTVVSTIYLQEALGLVGWLGAIFIVLGIFLLARPGGRSLRPFKRDAVVWSLVAAVSGSAALMVDAEGVRIAGVSAYGMTMFTLLGLVTPIIALSVSFRTNTIGTYLGDIRHNWMIALVGGLLSFLTYLIAIWAVSVAPIPIVASLREATVPISVLFGFWFLKNPLSRTRLAGAVTIFVGLLLVHSQTEILSIFNHFLG